MLRQVLHVLLSTSRSCIACVQRSLLCLSEESSVITTLFILILGHDDRHAGFNSYTALTQGTMHTFVNESITDKCRAVSSIGQIPEERILMNILHMLFAHPAGAQTF
jgi:hypothetical protein